ncbi:MAG: hypothetical protein IJV15_11485 [Lachnospiraceae bacterium]|nr:hypothetical protein [Lachnospiraceae bacterium]
MKKIILFGAGGNGKKALKKYGIEKIAYFCDNDVEKQGEYIDGVKVISFSDMKKFYQQGYQIVITPNNYWIQVGQLEMEGIFEYSIFRPSLESKDLNTIIKIENDCSEHNAILDEYVRESSKFDLLEDVTELKRIASIALEKNKKEDFPLVHFGLYDEGHFYGNLQNLMKYAGIQDDYDVVYAPFVSHSDCFPMYKDAFSPKTACVFSGDYYKQKVHMRNSYIPVFTVGPYIHYAKGIYDEETVKLKREKNGKTLLVYLPHTIEGIGRGYSREKFVDDVYGKYSNSFDTLLLCVYWADINDEVCDYARKKGFRIVSNGFRFDQNFNKRQRSLMEISDALVCGDIGTHIGFALYMGLPVSRVGISDDSTIGDSEFPGNIEKTLQFGKEYQHYKSEFYNIFDEEFRMDYKHKSWIDMLQGFNHVRDASYIKNMFEICRDIWIECDGKFKYYPEAVMKTLRKYEYDEIEKHIILQTSLMAKI